MNAYEPSAQRTVGVVIASTRAEQGIYADETGPIAAWMTKQAFETFPSVIAPDGEPVGVARSVLLSHDPAITTSGGTGLSPDDRTHEMTLTLLSREIPGTMEGTRRAGTMETRMAMLSHGHAGAAGETFIVNLPGSTKGVRDGLTILSPVIGHLCEQLAGKLRTLNRNSNDGCLSDESRMAETRPLLRSKRTAPCTEKFQRSGAEAFRRRRGGASCDG
ncbi:MogA/MoaB family molybdenum cofactor biosynthesis protein [Paenarthrobacter sp. NPDC089675]|uniref:MogA/MoaB family molybdenum cofactor biosynthesis protein n=1 Tax=Paenarthrobacter sp. NPDC089675 TaxID=3364376 RepID=UPI0037FD6852